MWPQWNKLRLQETMGAVAKVKILTPVMQRTSLTIRTNTQACPIITLTSRLHRGSFGAASKHYYALESTYSVGSAAQSYAVDQHGSGASMLPEHLDVEEEQKPHRFDERRRAADENNAKNSSPATSKTHRTSRLADSAKRSRRRFVASPVEDKPPTKMSPQVVTIDGSFFAKAWCVIRPELSSKLDSECLVRKAAI